MPTAEQAQLAVETHFNTEWGATTPIAWRGKPFPKELDAETYSGTHWVHFSFEMSDSFVKGVSDAPEYRCTGRVAIGVRIKKNLGTFLFTQVLGTLNGIFRLKTLSGVRLGAPLVSPEIEAEDDTWQVRVISYPFNFDDK